MAIFRTMRWETDALDYGFVMINKCEKWLAARAASVVPGNNDDNHLIIYRLDVIEDSNICLQQL